MVRKFKGLAAVAAVAALALSACGAPADDAPSDSDDAADAETSSVEITDNNGAHTIDVPPESVVALDNRTFQTLADWDIPLSAAARTLMPSTNPYVDDEDIPDVGNHREPDLEVIVAAEPDLIINGQRFTQYFDDIEKLSPDAVQIDLDPREDEPFDDELKRQVEVLGQIFDKEEAANELAGQFDESVEAVKEAYDSDDTVMAVNTSGGNIGFIAPSFGRTLGPLYDIFDLTPALEVEGASDDHQGDDISVEAIADANPDWILVMDRDAAILADDPEYVPANKVLEDAAALKNVTAIKEGNIVYMPTDTYTNEGIQTYTDYFNQLAEAFGG